jgi:hypothetical protein
VPSRVKGRKRNREVDKPLSGLNVDDLFRKEKRTKIHPDNAIPEFKQALKSSQGSSLTSCLTMTSFTLFFWVMGVGVSAAAVGLGLGRSALGSQQIPREYCFWPCGTFL